MRFILVAYHLSGKGEDITFYFMKKVMSPREGFLSGDIPRGRPGGLGVLNVSRDPNFISKFVRQNFLKAC